MYSAKVSEVSVNRRCTYEWALLGARSRSSFKSDNIDINGQRQNQAVINMLHNRFKTLNGTKGSIDMRFMET